MKINKKTVVIIAVLFGALTLGLPGVADTFLLNGEVPVHGKLLRSDDKFHYIDIGGRQKRLPKKSVKLLEKNDKDGSFDIEAARERAAKRQQQITEETGLTKAQRDEIARLILALNSEDGLERGDARRKLIEMCEDAKVYTYLAKQVPTEGPQFMLELIAILTQVDPVRANPLLKEFATYEEQNVRAECVELLGLIRDSSSLSLIMRGMLDQQPVVILAACTALTALGAKEATPLLLDKFNHTDLRVQNFAREALAVLWKTELGDREPFEALGDWNQFWNEQSASVSKTVNIETLEPLVPPGTHYSKC